MHGKKVFPIILALLILFSVGCRRDNRKHSGTDTEVANSVFKKIPSEELLGKSKFLEYPEDFAFVPTFLGEDGSVYGYSDDLEKQISSLVCLNTSTNEYKTIQTSKIDKAPVTFGTYYADKEYVVYNEYDYATSLSRYVIWNKFDGGLKEIVSVENVSPLHLTEIERLDNFFYIVTSDSKGNYPIVVYDISTSKVEVVEENNSGYPVVMGESLHYILLDNENLETKVVKYTPSSKRKEVILKTEGYDTFYSGLYSNKKDFLLLKQDQKSLKFFQGNLEKNNFLFEADSAELTRYHKKFVSFVGTSRDLDDGRMQYYLYDIDNRIDYVYEDSVLYLSEAGIFWVEYLKSDGEIPIGEIFQKDNSVMRFLKFDEGV